MVFASIFLFCHLISIPSGIWGRSLLTSGGGRGRIVGGEDTTITTQRHQLSLRVNGNHICGATLISSTRGVTGAHCLGQAVVVYSVLAGSTDRTDSSCSTCVVRQLIAYSRHPNYADNPFQGYPNDVAVISFTSIGSNGGIGYVAMATVNDGDFVGESCTITGWGQTSSGSQTTTLQQATITVIDNDDCNNAWPSTPISSGQICLLTQGVSPCTGDNGGPLICRQKLAGTMSWTSSDCNPSLPSVYTRISSYKAWIDGQ